MKSELIENRLIIWNLSDSKKLFSSGYYGKPIGVPKPKPEPVPNEFFSIHLGAFIAEIPVSNTPLDNAVFRDAKDVYHIINKEGIFIYLSGEFKELSDAVIEKYRLSKKGQRSVYVVKVIDRRKVVIVE